MAILEYLSLLIMKVSASPEGSQIIRELIPTLAKLSQMYPLILSPILSTQQLKYRNVVSPIDCTNLELAGHYFGSLKDKYVLKFYICGVSNDLLKQVCSTPLGEIFHFGPHLPLLVNLFAKLPCSPTLSTIFSRLHF